MPCLQPPPALIVPVSYSLLVSVSYSLLAGEALREALRAAGDAERDLDLLATGLRERLAGERLRLTGLRLLRGVPKTMRGMKEAG